MKLAVTDMDEAWDVAAQIEQRMQLDSGLGRPKAGPWKQCQAQVDGGGVQRIDGGFQVERHRLCQAKLTGLPDQPLGKLGMDTPVAMFVGIGQRRAFDGLAKAHVVELCGLGRQASFNVAQTLAIGELGERHHPELLGAGQGAYTMVSVVARHNAMKGLPRQEVHDLGEHCLADVHGRLRSKRDRERGRTPHPSSSRRHP